jgi:tetratricopeptide (TPR) repeat protein
VLFFVLPDAFAGILSTVWLRFPGLDKPVHFLAFIVVFGVAHGVLRSRVWPVIVSDRAKLGAALAVSLIISVADEAQQAVIGRGRTAELGDLVADAAGALVGMTVVSAARLGVGRAVGIGLLCLLPVAVVTARTYKDLKHFNLGMVYERERKYQEARAEYMLALDSGFQSAELYNTIAWLDIEFLEADPVEVEPYTSKALAMEPNNPDILETHGWVLVKIGKLHEGISMLERAKRLKPDIYCIDLHLGVAYREIGEWDRAIQSLNRQIERNPDSRWGRSARAALDQLEGGRNNGG